MLDGVLSFSSDGWTLVEDQLARPSDHPGALFSTSSGYFGVRGRRREPVGHDGGGVLVAGLYETRPYAHPEAAFAFPDTYQTLVAVTDPTHVAITVDGTPLAVDTGTWLEHTRELDLRTGCVATSGRWRSPDGALVLVRSTRMATLSEPGLLLTSFEVEPLDRLMRVELATELRANPSQQTFPDEPEALSRAWGRPLVPVGVFDHDGCVGLVHRTALSGLAVACAASVETAAELVERQIERDMIESRFADDAAPGRPMRLVQRSAFADGRAEDAERVLAAAADVVGRARPVPLDEAVAQQRSTLERFWQAADVTIEGDAELEAAVRSCAFQVLQASAGNPGRAAPAKGLTGQGYEGHHLWDQEVFVTHALDLLAPEASRALLGFRHRTLPQARLRARDLSLDGAQFPWRTIDGSEASGFLPAGAAQHHVDAAVAWAIDRHVALTGDRGVLVDGGVEVLVETARMWASIVHLGRDGLYRIPSVTGPDEYSTLVDDNLYTNVMAAWNLEAAADHLGELETSDPGAHAALVGDLGVEAEEVASWRKISAAMFVPFDDELGVHGQDDTFLQKPRWDLAATPPDRFPLQDHHHLLTLYRHQVVKQADVVMALFLQRRRFSREQRRRDYDHYEALTSHDSSLSAPIHAIVAADVGRLDQAWRFTREAALTDLDARAGNPAHGVHIASSAGAWLAIACGWGGFEVRDGSAAFRPQLPDAVERLRFRLRFRGSLVDVDIRRVDTTYRLVDGPPLEVSHDGDPLVLAPGSPVTRATIRPAAD